MKLYIQKDRASCMVCALAMCLNVPPEELDLHPEEIISDAEIPYCYRGVHPQELTLEALKYGKHILWFDRYYGFAHHDTTYNHNKQIDDLLQKHKAILLDGKHAVAYYDGLIYNPTGFIQDAFCLEKYETVGIII